MKNNTISTICTIFVALLITQVATASWTQVAHMNTPTCDLLSMPIDVDELGSPITPFPSDELIDHHHIGTSYPVCSMTDDPTAPDQLVEIINLTNRTFDEVWYVADEGTRISNVDGLAEDFGLVASGAAGVQRETFRIDNDIRDPGGIHHPLVFESNPNGVFDPGETWQFVLQDYSNIFGFGPDLFTSIGVGSASLDLLVPSSGSIVAIPVPEPSSMASLLASLVVGLGVMRRNG